MEDEINEEEFVYGHLTKYLEHYGITEEDFDRALYTTIASTKSQTSLDDFGITTILKENKDEREMKRFRIITDYDAECEKFAVRVIADGL